MARASRSSRAASATRVGLAWHPDTQELWFTDNGRDMLGDDQPNDELNVRPKPGLHFGYPYCHEGSILGPRVRQGQVVRRLHRAGAEAGAARRRARAEVLHRHDVPGGVPEAAVHRESRVVEPQPPQVPHRLPPDGRQAAGQQGDELRAVRRRVAAGRAPGRGGARSICSSCPTVRCSSPTTART